MQIQETFMEFWPESVRQVALPHTEVPLSQLEYEAVAICHRQGASATTDRRLSDVCNRISNIGGVFQSGYFMRLGYGSWSQAQMSRFGTLRVRSPMRPRDILGLKDKRLSSISSRFVDDFVPSIFIRPFFDFDSRRELRVPVHGDQIKAPIWREPKLRGFLEVARNHGDAAIELVKKISNDVPKMPLHIDVVPFEQEYRIVDINPQL